MPNHKSAEKRLRQSKRRRGRNRLVKTSVRTVIKKVRAAAIKSDVATLEADFRAAEKALATAASKGVFKKQNAARRISRLAKLVQAAKVSAAA